MSIKYPIILIQSSTRYSSFLKVGMTLWSRDGNNKNGLPSILHNLLSISVVIILQPYKSLQTECLSSLFWPEKTARMKIISGNNKWGPETTRKPSLWLRLSPVYHSQDITVRVDLKEELNMKHEKVSKSCYTKSNNVSY